MVDENIFKPHILKPQANKSDPDDDAIKQFEKLENLVSQLDKTIQTSCESPKIASSSSIASPLFD